MQGLRNWRSMGKISTNDSLFYEKYRMLFLYMKGAPVVGLWLSLSPGCLPGIQLPGNPRW